MTYQKNRGPEAEAHTARGIELADRGWLDEAINEFRKALAIDPSAVDAHIHLGSVLTEQSKHFAALTQFIDAVRLAPENAQTHHYLASFLAVHALPVAVASFKKSLEIDDEAPDTHLNLGIALSEQGELTEALAHMEQALSLSPDDALIQHELAGVLLDLERYPEAIGYLKKLCRSQPNHLEAHVDLGVAYTLQGFYAEAERALQRAVELDPKDFLANYQLTGLYIVWENNTAALAQLQCTAALDRQRLLDMSKIDPFFEKLHQNHALMNFLQSQAD